MPNVCHLCDKPRGSFNGFIWYSGNYNTELCRSCYTKWIKTKENVFLKKKYANAKPTTKKWSERCRVMQRAFDKWYYANGGVDA